MSELQYSCLVWVSYSFKCGWAAVMLASVDELILSRRGGLILASDG